MPLQMPLFSAQPAVLRSETTNDKILGSNFPMISGMGKISLSLKYWAYLPTRSFSWSSGFFSWTFQGAGLGGFSPCPDWIGLSVSEGIDKEGQFEPMRLVVGVSGSPCSSDCLGRASVFSIFSICEGGSLR